MTMKKIGNILKGVAVVMLTAACSGDDMPLTHPDGYGEVKFAIGNDVTRAVKYIPYDYNRDPHTMGVIGWYNMRDAKDLTKNKMFENLEVTAKIDAITDELSWTYSPLRNWVSFADYSTFDNFAYMPYNENAQVTRDDNVYTLTVPVDFGTGNPFSTDEVLMCNLPDYKNDADGVISFKMDQALTGYQLVFQLGEKMSQLRYFVVKSVKVYGTSFLNKGTLSREYTWNTIDKKWSSGDIRWNIDEANDKFDVTAANAVAIPYRDNSADAPTGKDWSEYYKTVTETVDQNSYGVLRVNKDAVPWGKPIYLLPATGFNPVFEVTYDAVVVNEEGKEVVTRKNVVSTISFDENNFEKLKTAPATAMGKARTIHVKIVPDHLYVLADADQIYGTITVQ